MQIKSPGPRQKTASEKVAILAAFAGTELTQSEFAIQQGIGLSTFQRWLGQSQLHGGVGSTPLTEEVAQQG
jgi:hypothetical protein